MTNATQSAGLNPPVERVESVAAARSLARIPQLKAVILIGSMARSEATWKRTPSGWEVLGDAEFVVVRDEAGSENFDVSALNREIESALASEQISCKIDVSVVPSSWLSNLGRTIFAYEIRNTGRVVCGDPSLLRLVPEFPSTSIDREDAWRLVCNRLVEWLEVSDDTPQKQYRSAKLLLDCASSLLVFTGNFEAGYENREHRIRSLNGIAKVPLDLPSFANLVSVCTDFKLAKRDSLPDLSTIAPTLALRIAKWEEAQNSTVPDFSTRLRAWAFVARATGWFREWVSWPRWSALALRTTPRKLVYNAAMQLIRAKLGELSLQDALESVRALPMFSGEAVESYSSACREVALNYNNFVLRSRA